VLQIEKEAASDPAKAGTSFGMPLDQPLLDCRPEEGLGRADAAIAPTQSAAVDQRQRLRQQKLEKVQLARSPYPTRPPPPHLG
jgi:hypothetical protein